MDETLQGTAFEGNPLTRHPERLAYIETYGCQMNFSDTEIVASVLTSMDYGFTTDPEAADLLFINTCSIRENAEDKALQRLQYFRKKKESKPHLMIGVLGCMAERLKGRLIEQEKLVDIVVGPDAYRDLPRLLEEVESGQKAINVLLSREETYADLSPVRLNSNGICAFVTIMRGCDNMCSFCVVPFTRGRERSRDPHSIEQECRDLYAQGYREVTLLGQNVDSYLWSSDDSLKGKAQILKTAQTNPATEHSRSAASPVTEHSRSVGHELVNFAQLLDRIARIAPDLRVRFSTSHPKDITDEVLHTMAAHDNICKYIHLPLQSGSSRVLDLMNRGYTREWYLGKVQRIREIMPECAISTDIISGFCTETDDDQRETLEVMALSRYSHAFMFAYSERPGTPAAKRLSDDVPEEVKKQRLTEIISLQNQISREINEACIGQVCTVLIEGDSRRSEADFCGRNDANQMVVFPKVEGLEPGQYVRVRVMKATSATLVGEIVS
ncbi:MAG: tRNA (N6-isopentenyl adenosine(37)-C2)-methylthiotransferase MiaB [Bacteroidetes bacterium]|nr:MAG: tRNA (N6-isopentenyl adenosine(37)-C2)-methylthiotransferase MiaB [Bacteroidota bacterium]